MHSCVGRSGGWDVGVGEGGEFFFACRVGITIIFSFFLLRFYESIRFSCASRFFFKDFPDITPLPSCTFSLFYFFLFVFFRFSDVIRSCTIQLQKGSNDQRVIHLPIVKIYSYIAALLTLPFPASLLPGRSLMIVPG